MLTVTQGVPRCAYGACRGQIALIDEGDQLRAACLHCGREPGRPAVEATPEIVAKAARDAFVRRQRHHRQFAPAAFGGG